MTLHLSAFSASNRLLAILLVTLTTATRADAGGELIFVEPFENLGFVPIGEYGPAGLIANGWVFINNGQPAGPEGWFAGCCWGGLIEPLSGTGYLAAGPNASGGLYSTWAILPEVPGQKAGDLFTFYTISSDTSPFDNASLEVRYSPTGGIDVGSSATSVGDFTELLLDIPTIPNFSSGIYDGWTKWEIVLPGSGRLAFRQDGDESLYFGIEDVSIESSPQPDPLFPEDFEDLDGVCGEGPCTLIDRGWVFKDQGTLNVGPAWEPNNLFDGMTPHEGVSFMKSVKGGDAGSINTWAILPPIPGQANGDVLTFFVRGHLPEGAVMEVRYAPDGGTNTGSGGLGVGSFTDVLYSTSALLDAWVPVSVTIPGTGSIALRLHDPSQPFFEQAAIVAVDSMAVNTDIPGPPIPGDGETVTWTSAISPIVLDTEIGVPSGGTVIIEPGVEIQVVDEGGLLIHGEMIAHGTREAPIVITTPFFLAPPPFRVRGQLDLAFATVTGVISASDGTVIATSCTFPGGLLGSESLGGRPQLVMATDCAFSGANSGIAVQDGQLTVRNSTFEGGGGLGVLRGYLHVDDVTIDGAALSISRQNFGHPLLLDHLTVTNANTFGGLFLEGWNYFIGPDVTLKGNLYPIVLNGGLLPGSAVPAEGNQNNVVLVPSPSSPSGFPTWAPLSVPYLVDGIISAGQTILPGVTVRFTPGSLVSAFGLPLFAEGLPDSPITFEGEGGQWDGLFFQSNGTAPKLEHCIIRGAKFGAVSSDTPELRLESCTFEGNMVGSNSNSFGTTTIRSCQFIGNGIGVEGTELGSFNLFGGTNPNTFEGNGIGATDPSGLPPAQHNWWGDPSGPSHPANPGGMGDIASPNIQVLPFRTAPPDPADYPPVVRLHERTPYAEPGDTLILSWSAFDNPGGAIVSQRVLFVDHFANQFEVIADNLPPSQRSLAVIVPQVFQSSNNLPSVFRVIATDDSGQEGMDQATITIPTSIVAPVETPIPGTHFTMGEPIPFPFQPWELIGLFDATGNSESFGANSSPSAPFVSSDLVRVAQVMPGSAQLHLGPYFTVRPDERIGDAPPTVELLAPTGGNFTGGDTVPISWSAADDEAIRSVTVQASTDGGKSWMMLARDLPPDQERFNWMLPPLEWTVGGVLVRVVAFDRRFQSSSATSNPITLLPGVGSEPLAGDLDGNGIVDGADLGFLLASWGPCAPGGPCDADLTGDGVVDGADLGLLLAAWTE